MYKGVTSHSESASSWDIWCVRALGAVPFYALILVHMSDDIYGVVAIGDPLSLGYVPHMGTQFGILFVCRLYSPDSLVMYVFYIPLV